MARMKKMTGATSEQVEKVIEQSLPKFTKEQLLKSQKYAHRRDALSVILKDGEHYTHVKVDTLLNQFYKGGN